MTQNEARIETLRALVAVAYDLSAPLVERQAAWFRFKAICRYYRINPRDFEPIHYHIPARTCQFIATKPPLRPTTQSLISPQQKKRRIMRAQKPAESTPVDQRNQKTVHKDCTHPDTKTGRAKCRRHKEKEAERLADHVESE